MGFLFEKLDVYQRAVAFAEGIHAATRGFSRGNFALADQLKRASVSISANIAEGSGRFHKADKRNFYIIARGSAYECVPLLKIASSGGLLSAEDHLRFREDLMHVVRMLTRLEQVVMAREGKK